MLVRALVVMFIVAASAVQAQTDQQESFSLEEAVEYALKHNTEVLNAELGIKQAQHNVNEQTAEGLPQLNGTVNYTNYPALPVSLIPAEFLGGQPGEFAEVRFGTEHNLSASVNLSQMIFDGRFFAGLKAARIAVDLSRKQYDLSKVEVRATIKTAYYNALITKQYEDILMQSLASAEKLHEETKELYSIGFVESIEVDRLKLALTNVRSRLNSVKRQTTLAEGLLKFQMGYDMSRPITLTDTLNPKAVVDSTLLMEDITPNDRTDYQLLATHQNLRETYLRTIRSGYYPSASLFGTAEGIAQRNEFNFLDFDQDWYATVLWGVRLNIPIWDSFRKHNAIQEEKLNIQTIKNQRSNLAQAIELELLEKRTNYRNALDEFNAQQENLELAQRIFDVATEKYNEGVGSSLELENSQSGLYETQFSYITAFLQLVQAKADLEKALEK